MTVHTCDMAAKVPDRSPRMSFPLNPVPVYQPSFGVELHVDEIFAKESVPARLPHSHVPPFLRQVVCKHRA